MNSQTSNPGQFVPKIVQVSSTRRPVHLPRTWTSYAIALGMGIALAMVAKSTLPRLSAFSDKPVISVKGKKVRVIDRSDNVKAGEMIAWVDANILALRSHIDTKYTDSFLETIPERKRKILRQLRDRLHSNYRSASLVEHLPTTPRVDVSYNLDKGEVLAMCVRTWSDTAVLHQKNDVLFVALHEVAHSLNCNEAAYQCGDSYGHDDMFWYLFKQLLDEAEEIGIYSSVNYGETPVNYCSLDITYSPQFDKKMRDEVFLTDQ